MPEFRSRCCALRCAGSTFPAGASPPKKPGRMVCLRLSFASGRKWQHNSRLPLGFKSSKLQTYQPLNLWCTLAHDRMAKKSKPEIKLGATVRLRAQSGEIVEGRVVHMWEEKSALMVRVASGQLVYNVPASMLVDERGSK